MEALAIAQRQTRHEQHILRIVGIDVKDRRLDDLRHVAAIIGGTGIARIGGRETDLVVDDDMNRAPGPIAARLGQLQRFHDDALAGERGIAVHQHRHDLVALGILAALLACAHRALHHRIDDLQVRWVEGQHDVHVTAWRAHIGGEALVILDVAGPLRVIVVVLAFEFREQLSGRFAQHIDQHIEPTAMRHAEHEFLDAGLAPELDELVERGDQRVRTLE